MTLDQLRIFVHVAEREHVTQAALKLNIAQSAVSNVIAKLEDELGLTLFDRIGRNIRLSAAGHAFRIRANELLDHADDVRLWIADYKPGVASNPAVANLCVD